LARKPMLNSIKVEFERITVSAVNLVLAVYPYTQKERIWDGIHGWEPLHPAQAHKVIALSFMQVVSAWERFIQDCFLRYMMGASSPSGYSPVLRIGPCQSLQHAGQIITGKADFKFEKDIMSWSSWKLVTERSKIYFQEGRPFTDLKQPAIQRLSDAFNLRNRVAHNSRKSIERFKIVAREHLCLPSNRGLRRGFGVGELLTKPPQIFSGNYNPNIYFLAYVDLFLKMADTVAP